MDTYPSTYPRLSFGFDLMYIFYKISKIGIDIPEPKAEAAIPLFMYLWDFTSGEIMELYDKLQKDSDTHELPKMREVFSRVTAYFDTIEAVWDEANARKRLITHMAALAYLKSNSIDDATMHLIFFVGTTGKNMIKEESMKVLLVSGHDLSVSINVIRDGYRK